MDDEISFKLNGLTPIEVATSIAEAVNRLAPYVTVDVVLGPAVFEEKVVIRKQRIRIVSDDD